MPLSRLENFLKNIQGNVIYVDPNELDATDSIENQGNSQTRPFKTIQRALIEAARFSYVAGQRNDKFDQTTIILAAGTHVVDNRPGYIPYDSSNQARYYTRFGQENQTLSPFGLGSNFDLTSADNELFKLNSVRGGVIIPRGTSIVGKDLRKTKIRPKYVPDPENNAIETSAIFRLTGACYISQFTIFDGDPSGNVYKDYTSNLYTPNFSHHKLTCFEYVDGANAITINDSFLNISSTSTDLDMYYQKVGDVYDVGTGRPIEPDFPSGSLDFQTRVEEYRIVGSKGQQVGISSIKAGTGAVSSTTITVDLNGSLTDLSIDTPVRISGVGTAGYNGIHVVAEVVSSTQFKYVVPSAPNNPLPTLTSADVNIEIDTINSASPYLFNLSKRSVFGMNGIHLDGSKVTGFKSGLLAQFTGNALQKDDKAFVRYNTTSGQYEDYTAVDNLHLDPEAIYRPEYKSSHVKVSNDSIMQAVSVFAIGHNNQYVAESGGELSLANCNANFGENALMSEGFKKSAFGPDNAAYITHIIPPKEITDGETNVDYLSVDVDKTIGVGTNTRLYFEGYTNQDAPPPHTLDGFRVGSNLNDRLRVQLNINGNEGDFVSKIVMPTATGITTDTGEKSYVVGNAVGVSSISSNLLTLKSNHNLIDGESIRITADNGFLPDGLEENEIYFAIVSSLNANTIKVARTLNDALDGTALTINNTGGELSVVSRVSDKKSGDIGHPVQFDTTNKNWYVNVSNISVDNEIYPTLVGVGTTALGPNTPKTYFTRKGNSRNLDDSIYRVRYVIPAGITTARPPIEGYVLQETSDTTGANDSEITTTSLTNIDDQRNFHFLSEASWNSNVATVMSEEPHHLTVGSVVNVNKITSSNNSTGVGNSGFNGRFAVTGITSDRGFQYALTNNPGTSTLSNQTRTVDDLPNFEKNEYSKSFYIYNVEEVKEHITGEQDGVYHLTCLHYDASPTVTPFTGFKFSQPVKDLYPQVDRDNPSSDPIAAFSHAESKPIGKVISSDIRDSITKDFANKFLLENGVNVGITSIVSDNGAGLAHTAYLTVEHQLNSIVSVGIASSGIGYGSGSPTTLYGAKLIGVGIGSTSGGGALANITVDSVGGITGVTIINGGGAYGIGNSLEVIGVTTAAGHIVGMVTVTNVYDGVGEVIQIAGIRSDTNRKLNDTFRVTATPDARSVSFASTDVIDFGRSLGGGSNNIVVGSAMSNATMSFVGPSIGVTAISYDVTTGIATVGTGNTAHGFLTGSKIKLIGAGQTSYKGTFTVQENVGLSTFTVNLGVSTSTAPTLSGTVFALPGGYSSNDGAITEDNEKVGSRMNSMYAGISTTMSAGITSTSSSISISNATASGLNIGDYIMVGNEMMRIKNTSINSVFRGIFGTESINHPAGTVIKKVRVVPVELRRGSLIRAANQTFEYVGFGQGNYSVSLPEKQTKVLSTEDRKLGQTQKRNGGQNYYTGLNDVGEYFVGNKVIKGTTGEEEVFDAPIPTVTGENTVDTTYADSLKVSGGTDRDVLSKFDGPTLFTNKVTSTSEEGIETNSIQLQGDAKSARKITVGISTPVVGGSAGDITFNTKPSQGGYAGWVYTSDNVWRRFGLVSNDVNSNNYSVDKLGIGTTSANAVLDVLGDVNVSGTLTATTFGNINTGIITATSFVGDGSQITGVIGVGSGFVIQNNGTTLGMAATVNFNSNLTAEYSTGIATISSPDTNYWSNTDVGINTTASVGIGTTNPTTALTVSGIVSATTFAGNITGTGATFTTSTITSATVGSAVTITESGINAVSGVVTATSFVGSLTGNVTGDLTGTATNATLAGYASTAGIATVAQGLTGSPAIAVGILTSTEARVGGAVTISESGISIHSGIVTATSFVGDGSALTGTGNTADVRTSTLTVIGVSTIGAGATFTIGAGAGNGVEFINGSSSKIRLSTDNGATSPRLFLGAVSSNTGANLQVNASTGALNIDADNNINIRTATNENAIVATASGSVGLYFDGSEKLTTANTGAVVSGILTATTFSGNLTGTAVTATTAIVGSAVTISESGVNVTGVVTATSFVGDGSNLTGISGVSTTHVRTSTLSVVGVTTLGIASISASGIVTTTDAVGILTYHGDVSNAANQRWYLGANGSDDYTFVGSGMTFTRHDPTLFVARGSIVEFVNNMGAHPLRIQLQYQNTGGTAYTDGVTVTGSASQGVTRFEVPHDAPNTLYYQCTSHSGMAGTITVYPTL